MGGPLSDTTGITRFEGRIAGFGVGSGATGAGAGGAGDSGRTRIVIGMWERSPFGRFADVMVESADGHRLLLAPNAAVAEYVSSTYTFDEVRVVPVRFGRAPVRVGEGDAAGARVGGGAGEGDAAGGASAGRATSARAAGGAGAGRGGGDAARRIRVSAGPLGVTLQVGGPTAVGRLVRAVPRRIAEHPVWLQAIDPVARVLVPGARTSGSAGGGRREFYGVTQARAITAVDATWDGSALGGVQRLEPPVTFGFGSAPATPTLVDIVTSIRERP